MCERQDANRTTEAGHLDEIQGVVANSLSAFRHGASLLANIFGVGWSDWLDDFIDEYSCEPVRARRRAAVEVMNDR